MRKHTHIVSLVLLGALAGAPSWSTAQGRPDPAALLSAQRQALSMLAFMDGVWHEVGDTDWPSAGAIGPK